MQSECRGLSFALHWVCVILGKLPTSVHQFLYLGGDDTIPRRDNTSILDYAY